MRIVRTSHLTGLGLAALGYARRGWPVLPCRPRSKVSLISSWPARATTDPAVVAEWWTSWPEANIGLLTGAPGPDVLDIDVREGGDGFDVLSDLTRLGHLRGASRRVRTPSGGEHWYFQGSAQRKAKLAGLFVDFQARGGYVIAPPSVLVTDGRSASYHLIEQWPHCSGLDWSRLSKQEAATGPVAGLRPSSRSPRSRDLRGVVRRAVQGDRNNALFYAANRMLDKGMDPMILLEDARTAGLGREEALATIASAQRQERRRPGAGRCG